MLTIRRAEERGCVDHGWLLSRHTFSFGDYYDPEHKGFSVLRVINEDTVAPGAGFDIHGHRDMEIVSYVLEGALEHRDDMGNGAVIRAGDVQRMSAGTGIRHSEFNPSQEAPVHFLQIWILPERYGLEPGYEQVHVSEAEKRGRLHLVAGPDASAAVRVHQDAALYAALLEADQSVAHRFVPDRRGWLHVARGAARVNDTPLRAGDGLAIEDEAAVEITGGVEGAELLLFELP